MDLVYVRTDGRHVEIHRANDPRRGGHDLFGREDTTRDQGPDHRVTDLEAFGGLLHRTPSIAGRTGRIEDREVLRVPQRHDARRRPGIATARGVAHSIQDGRDLPVRKHAHQSTDELDDVVARTVAMLPLSLLPDVQGAVLSAGSANDHLESGFIGTDIDE